jgi:hypothetical protein
MSSSATTSFLFDYHSSNNTIADTCLTARTATKQLIVTKIGRLSLWRNDSSQYMHAAIMQLKKGIQRVLKQHYNPDGGVNGMLDLLKKTA